MYKRAGIAVLACIFCGQSAIAQTSGTISGVVHDASGAVVPGAPIAAKNVETGLSRTATTDAQGRYQFSNLRVGQYEIQATLSGFRTAVRSGVALTVGQEAVVNLTLQLGQVEQIVEVTGEAPVVEATNAAITGLVNEAQVRDLPLNGRSFDQLMTLQVGTVFARHDQDTSALGGGHKVSISGVHPTGNSFLLDGTDINDPRNFVPGSSSGLTLGVETVREFRVLTNAFSAEYGRAHGGILTAVTRSGTNTLHGTVFEFLRNDNLDAYEWKDKARRAVPEKPEFKRNQFGFTLGGPIKRDRTFFFGSYEGLRERLGQSVLTTVPTARAKAGCMPERGRIGAQEVCFSVEPAVKPWMALYPDPNGPNFDHGDGQGDFSWSSSQPTTQNYLMARVDHSFSSNHTIFGRYTRDFSEQISPASLPIDTRPQSNKNRYLTVQLDSIVTPTTVNTLRFGMNKSRPYGTQHIEAPENLTLVPGLVHPDTGKPLLFRDFGAWGGMGTQWNPRGTDYTLLEWSDDVTLVLGSHTMKTGFIFKKIYDFQDGATNRGGQFSTNDLWDTLHGTASATFFNEWPDKGGDRDWRMEMLGAYLQDDFKMMPNFTWNLGVRLEFMTSPMETKGRCANITDVNQVLPFSVGGKIGPNALPGAPLGTTDCPFFETFKNNWAPRLGFAWDTRNNSKLLVRGGWGMFYSMPFTADWRASARYLPPDAFYLTVPNVSFPDAKIDYSGEPSGTPATRSLKYGGTPYAMQYNFNIQSEVHPGTGVTLGYAGSQTRKAIISMHKNVRPWTFVNGRKMYLLDQPRANPYWASNNIASTEGSGSYNSFLASVTQRFRGGLRAQLSYTFGKTMSISDTIFGDDFGGDASGGVTDGNDPGMDWGLASFSIKHNLSVNYSYDLPFKTEGAVGRLIEGWQVSGIISRQSGVPFNVNTSFEVGDGLPIGSGGAGSPNYRPNLVPGMSNNPIKGTFAGCSTFGSSYVRSQVGKELGGPDLYFDPCAFSSAPRGFYGTLGRHTVIGPSLVNLDFSVVKNTLVTERTNLQFRAELFNILNHPNFSNPSASVFARNGTAQTTPGRISGTTTTARQIQFGLKFIF